MDVPRQSVIRRRWMRRGAWIAGILIVVPLATWGLSRLKPAAPTVERGTVWIDRVQRGPMLRQVRGLGTLVPEETLLIPAVTDGRIERIVIRPGAAVSPQTVIAVLSNPDLELARDDLQWQVKAAEASYKDLEVKLATQKLEQRARAAQVKAEHTKAQLQSDRDRELQKNGLTADITVRQSSATAEELAGRSQLEAERLAIFDDSITAQLAAQQVQIEKLRAAYGLKQQQVGQLTVRAGVPGILQAISMEVGQRVTAGAQLAKVAQPTRLKAELKVPETQAKDVQIGQPAQIDTHNGVIAGRVMRIDPAVLNGTVTVDVQLLGELPQGARPDLSVDGVIELERLTDVLFVGRPTIGQPNGTITLFRLVPGSDEAIRVPVQLGRMSVNTVEIRGGLAVGDQVVLSDMTGQEDTERVRLQ